MPVKVSLLNKNLLCYIGGVPDLMEVSFINLWSSKQLKNKYCKNLLQSTAIYTKFLTVVVYAKKKKVKRIGFDILISVLYQLSVSGM